MTSSNWFERSADKFSSAEEKNNIRLLYHAVEVLKKQEGLNPFKISDFLLYIPSQIFVDLDGQGVEKTQNKFSDIIFKTQKISGVMFSIECETRIFDLSFVDSSEYLPIYGKYGVDQYKMKNLCIEFDDGNFEVLDDGSYEFEDVGCAVNFIIQLESDNGHWIEGDFVILPIPE